MFSIFVNYMYINFVNNNLSFWQIELINIGNFSVVFVIKIRGDVKYCQQENSRLIEL